MKIKNAAAAILVVFILASCATTSGSSGGEGIGPKQPDWMVDLNQVYPEQTYLASIGGGRNLEDAQRQATSSLSAMFKVRVEGTLSVLQGVGEVAGPEGVTKRETTQIIDMVEQQVDNTLYYVKYSSPWDGGSGEIYVVAYMNREEAGKAYRDLIDANTRDVMMYRSRAEKESTAIGRYALYNKAFMKVLENEVLNEQLMMIKPTLASEFDYNKTLIAEKRGQASSLLSFSVRIEGDQEERAAKTLLEELEQRGLKGGSGSASPYLIEGSWKTWPITVDNPYDNLQWRLELSVLDENGQTLLTYDFEQKDAGMNLESALNRVNLEVERRLREDFMKKRFDGMLEAFAE